MIQVLIPLGMGAAMLYLGYRLMKMAIDMGHKFA